MKLSGLVISFALPFFVQALETTEITLEARTYNAIHNEIFARQFTPCKTVRVPLGGIPPNICELSCGPGYITCVKFPTCYNPGKGDSCCEDGKYCRAGTYCTDAGCCPDNLSLQECRATTRLRTLLPPPPPASTPTVVVPPPPTSTSTTISMTVSTSTSISTSTSTSSSTLTIPAVPTVTDNATSTVTPPVETLPVSGAGSIKLSLAVAFAGAVGLLILA